MSVRDSFLYSPWLCAILTDFLKTWFLCELPENWAQVSLTFLWHVVGLLKKKLSLNFCSDLEGQMSYPWLLPHKKTFIGQRKTSRAKDTYRIKRFDILLRLFLKRNVFHNLGSRYLSIQICLLCLTFLPQWWVELDDELSWLFTTKFRAFYLNCRK